MWFHVIDFPSLDIKQSVLKTKSTVLGYIKRLMVYHPKVDVLKIKRSCLVLPNLQSGITFKRLE